ncbi:hypothetical protein EKN56_00085 [Limnobaculum zhutongyuii]|uniref:Ig-like domain repeat protein n=1 Tax=Limnobaculum zhutongyuii TaxID=2498113 RepID=A0A411WFI1_9GAMM|nr:Ig-like domain-containing protein [Limnobaculum zhutongyuii]QBH94949.1 hypothetical protein EKN56_00085 [Limnobaculum zhutongyuii]TQS86314.1 hypothetical protein ELQ32_19480 [Limnobaculum zhutongyuii]
MNKNVSLLVNSGSGPSQIVSLDAGKPIKIKIQPGTKYLLKNQNDNFAPENATLQRNGDDLYVILEGDSTPAIVIEDYYISGNNTPLLGMAEDGQVYAYVITDGSGLGDGYLFNDGSFAPVALGGASQGDGSYLFAETENDYGLLALWPWFLGAAVIGGIVGNAIYEHNKDDKSSPAPEPASVPTISGATDITGTITGEIAYGSVTDEKNPTIYGTGEAGNTITVYDNGKAIGSTVVGSDGKWSFKPDTALADGSHKITITQTNPAGSTSGHSDDLTFTVDATAPNKPLFSDILDDVGSIQGPIANGATTDDARPEFTGKGEAGNTITIFIDGKEVGKTTIGEDGTWSWTPTEDLADGHYQVTVTETDKAGNTSETSPTFDFNVDTTAPDKPPRLEAYDDVGDKTGLIENGDITDDARPEFKGWGEAGNTIIIYDNSDGTGRSGGKEIGRATVGDDGTWSWTPDFDLADGSHSITYTQTDKAGNVSEPSDSRDFIVDTAGVNPPDSITIMDNTGAITGPIQSGDKTDETKPEFSGKGTPGGIITIYDNNEPIGSVVVGEDGNWSLIPDVALEEGSHSITTTETSKSGNESDPSAPIDFVVDTTPPSKPEIGGVTDNTGDVTGPITSGEPTDETQPEFNGEGEPGSTIVIKDKDGEIIGSTIVDEDGKWTVKPEQPLEEGSNSLVITETDTAGNESDPSDPFEVVVDTTPPSKPEIGGVTDNTGNVTGPITSGEPTDEKQPEFSGEGEPGSTITLKDEDGNVLGTATVDEDGKWTVKPEQPLEEGSNSLVITETDTAGNESDPSDPFEVVVDTIAPEKPTIGSVIDHTGTNAGDEIQPGDETNETRPELTGVGEPGSTITLKDEDGNVLGTAIVDEGGNWSVRPDLPLEEGSNSLVITETDTAGNESDPSDPFEMVVDTTPPTKPGIDSVIDDQGSVTGPILNGSQTDDTTPTFSGEGEPGNIITITDGGKVIGSTVIDENGAWTFTPETPLEEGAHNIVVTETDKAGNTSDPSDSFEFVVDTTPPDAKDLKITGVEDNFGEVTGNITSGSATDDSRPTIHGTGTANDTIIVYAKDATGNHVIGSTTVGADGKWSLQPTTPLLPGENVFTAVEVDPVGNATNPSDSYTVMLDPSRPTEAGYLVRIYDGVTLIGSVTANDKGVWTFTPDTALADGKHNITATATSPVGQTSDKTGIFNFEVDTKAPNSVENLQVFDNVGDKQGYILDGDTTDDATPTFSGKAEAESTVTIYDNGNAIGTAKVDSNGNWSFTPDSKLPDGEHIFTTSVTDKAGNTNTDSPSLTITIDTTGVVVSISALIDDVGDKQGNITPNGVTDDTKPEIIGEGKPGSTVTIYDGSVKLGETTVKANGTWSFTPTTPLKEGSHSITVIAKDQAGNSSDRSSAFEFTVDTTAPNMPTIESAQDDVGSKQDTLHSGDKTDDSTPTLTGTAEKGSVVNVYGNGALLGSTIADSTTGKWTFTPPTPVAEGENKFHVTATDAAGNVSKPSADFVLTMDFTGPDIDALKITEVIDNVGKVTGNVESGKETDDNRPTIKGEGTSGDTIFVYVKDDLGERLLGTATVDTNGKWSLRPDTVLNSGKNVFTAEEMDPVGNKVGRSNEYDVTLESTPPSPPTIDRVEDNVGSITGALQKGDVTDDNTPTLKGTAVANGIVTIYNNGNVIGSAQVDDKGAWQFTPNPALKDGFYNLTADATDPVGRVSDKTGIFNFEVDTTKPDAAQDLKITDNEGDYQGLLYDRDTTDDSTPTFSGKAEVGSVVTIYNDGTAIGSVKVADNGSWTFTPSDRLPDGDYKFTTTVTDKAGNVSDASPTVNITIDTSKVPVSIDRLYDDQGDITGNIEPNGVTDDTRPEIFGSGKAGSVITVYDGATELGSTTVKADGSWSFTPNGDLGQGKHSITVISKEPSGNVEGPTAAFEFNVDSVAPGRPTIDSALDDMGAIQDPLYHNSATDDPTPTLMGKAENGSIVKIYVDGALLGSAVADSTTGAWSYTPTSAQTEGKHTFYVTATDKAGNVSQPSADFVLTMDFTGPDPDALKITEVIDNVGKVTGNVESGKETDDTRPTIKGEGTSGDTIFVYVKDDLGERLLGTATVDTNGKWSLRPDTVLNSGKNVFTAVEMDPVGNKVGPSNEYDVTLETTPPSPPTIDRVEDNVGSITGALQKGDVTDDNTPTLKGTAVANGIVTIYNDGNVIGSAQVDDKGAWQFTPNPALKDGFYNLTADATNPIGQVSDKTGIFNFEVDTTKPGAVQDLKITDNEGDYQGLLYDRDTTDDSTPTFSGKAEVGSVVTIYNDGTAIGSVKVADNGSWTFTPSDRLPDGDYKFTTTVTDKAGNVSDASPTVNITIDTSSVPVSIDRLYDDQGDITGNIEPNGVTDDARPEIFGKGKAGSIITIFDGATELGSTTVKPDGSWSFTPSGDLGQGKHSITAVSKEPSGNVEGPTAAFEFSVDTVAPARPTIESAIDDVGAIQDPLYHNSATDDPTPTLMGKAENGSIVKIYVDGALLGSAVADSTTGAWSYTPTSAQTEGKHTFYATSTDAAGNVSQPSTDFVLTMDFTGPDIDALKIVGVDDQVGDYKGNIKDGEYTDDTRPTIKGEGTAGDTIFVYVEDGAGKRELGTAKVDINGKWELRPSQALSTGDNVFTAVEMDPVGNKVGPSDSYKVIVDSTVLLAPVLVTVLDDQGPITGELKSGDVTDDAKPVFEGTAAADSIVKMYDGTTLLGSAKADSLGNWTITPDQPLKDGSTYNITFTATSTIGQVSDPSDVFVVTVDTTPPSPVTDLKITDNEGDYQGLLYDRDTTDDATPTFSGQAEPNSIVTIYNDGVAIGSATVTAGGTWTFTPTTELPDGKYKFTTTVTDKAGNISDATSEINITIDTSTLSVTIEKLIDDVGTITGDVLTGEITDDLRPEIVGTGSKPGSIITIFIDGVNQGTATVKADGSWSFIPATDLGQGVHKVTITGKDASGNVTPVSPEFIFTIDNIPPAAPTIEKAVDDFGTITGDLKTGDKTDDNTPTLHGNAEKGSIITIYDENDKPLGSVVANDLGKWVYELPPQADGRHDYYVIASDEAGNQSTPTPDFTLTIDTQGPTGGELKIDKAVDNVGIITGDLKSGEGTDDNRPELTGTGHEIGNTIIIYAEGEDGIKRQVGSTTVGANNIWTHELVQSSALADGTYKFTVVEVDAVGNTAGPSPEFIITIDTSVSDAKITITDISDDSGSSNTDFITNDNTLLINGTLDKALLADEWVKISLDGGNTWTRAASVTGTNWTVDLQGTVLADGKYTIQARVVDDVGNIGNKDSHDMTIVTVGRDMEGLNTTINITTDTNHGLVSGDLFSQSATSTNTDMVTRDRNVTIGGTLTAALKTGELLQISLDNGATWHNVAMAGNSWSYVLPEVSADTVYNAKLQVIDNVGNVGINTAFTNDYKVTIDLTVPDSIQDAPDVNKIVSTQDDFNFDSSRYGRVEAGAIVSLISDVNGNGTYQEGLDQVLGFAVADGNGNWTLNTKLPAGAHNLAFMVWDEAGNHSSLGGVTSVGVTDGAGSTLIEQSWGGTVSPGRGLNSAAVTISQDGTWSFFQAAAGTSGSTTANAGRVYTATDRENYESTYLAQPSNVTDGSYDRYINSAVFADINRDGYTDVMSQVSSYGNGGRTAYWLQNADGSFTANAVDQGTLNHLGGVVAYDRHGDGYLDFVLADSEADSISFMKNEGGVLSYEKVSGFDNGHPGGAIPGNLSVMHEVGAVDIDNNGTIDITAHIDYNGAGSYVGNTSRGLGILYNQTTGSSKTNFGSVGYYANVFRNDGHEDYGNLSISMTYADYNGDGWLDLFLSRGSKNSANSNESRIYLNDGTGKLLASDNQALWFGDSLDGGTSLAVDWNHDGKVDIIEVPRSGVNDSPVLYTNTGTDTWGANAISLTGTQKFNNLTGAIALDYDWDGSMDLVLYRGGTTANVVKGDSAAPTLLVKNTNIAADGTSLQIRIVDGEGINTFYSNTVKLYNSAGELVATQLINPQASGSSNSMGLVSFFGLDPNEVYSVQLLRITNGVENHVGATSTIGGYTNGTVNETWGGLTTSKAHDAYVLTAENTNDAINTTGASGITGTGYNDTFFSSAGNDTYTGGGGWNLIMNGEAVWSETEGLDIVDYSRATSGVTANLRTGTATGHGNDTLVSIEGLIGSAYNDTFTDSAANNQFEGGAGDDTFNLYNGGNDKLIYRVVAGKEGDAAGGTGHDTIFGFKVGDLRTDKNADLIDLSDLLNYSGPISYYMDEGKMTLDYASRGVLDYLKVEFNGSDTVISIDRDGKGGAYGFQELITLKGVNTDLETLLVNNQIEVGDDNIVAKTATTESLLSITQMFTGGDDIMFGTDKADVLMGGLGDDTFIGIGKDDKVMGGEGNDTISIISTDFASISGDEGIDTLILDMSGELLDLSALKDKLSSVEIFDMGNGNNTMNVSLEDVLRLGSEELAINSGNKAIVVNGEAGSTLQLEGARVLRQVSLR